MPKELEDAVHDFLSRSSMAKKIELPARVVVKRLPMRLWEVQEIAGARAVEIATIEPENAELEIGGRIVARGQVVEDGKSTKFQITEIVGQPDGKAQT